MMFRSETEASDLSDQKPEKGKNKKTNSTGSGKKRKTSNYLLRAYMEENKHYPLLTQEEEADAVKRYRELGDQEARQILIVSNLRLVVKIAFKFSYYTKLPLIDLIQEGNIGLIRAVKKYDPNKNAKLSYYASFWIKALIIKHITDNQSLVKHVTTEAKRKLYNTLKKEKKRLSKLGIDPDVETLAENLDVAAEDIQDMENYFAGELSLDETLSEQSATSWTEFLSSDVDVEKTVFDNDFKEKGRALFDRFRKTLDARELLIFNSRICCEEACTLDKLGLRLDLSRERVRQIEKDIYEKLFLFKEKEDAMTPQEREFEDVSYDDVRAVCRKKTNTREVALLYFGLHKDSNGPLDARQIADKTGLPLTSVYTATSQLRQRIRALRKKQKETARHDEPSEGKQIPPNPEPPPGQAGKDTTPARAEKATALNPKQDENTAKAVAGQSLHLLVERGGKKFEMDISGGPIYDLLVKYLGL